MKKQVGVLDILIVQDHMEDYILIEEYLSDAKVKFKSTRATSFQEAAAELNKKHSFKIILLDLSLSDVENKEELVVKMLALAQNIPIIVFSDFAYKEFGLKVLSLGISDYLFKNDLNSTTLPKSIFYSIERKYIDLRLGESEKNYKTLFDFSPYPLWVLDKHTLEFLKVNNAAVKIYGYTKEEFLTMTVRDLWAEDMKEVIHREWQENYHGQIETTARHCKNGGSQINVEILSNPIVFDGREARITQIKDITAQLEAEQALRCREKRFRALVQDASDLIMIVEFCGDLTYVSPSSMQMTGFPDSDLIQNNFFDYIHHDDVNVVKTHLLKLKTNKRIQIPSYRFRTSSKKWIYIETIVTNLMDDISVKGLVANSRDITAFIQQEKKLIHSLKRYDIVAKATSDIITDYDIVHDKMYYNEGIESVFGYKKSEIENTGKWWNDKLHPEDKERVARYSTQVKKLRTEQIQIEYRFKCADGSYKYILDRSYLIKDDAGNALRIIGAMQDITEIQNYIKTIEEHNSKLKEIAWTQSHVVRAPLARIMGIIDLIETCPDTEEQTQLLKHINSSAIELDTIIRKITKKTEDVSLTSNEC